MTRKPAAASGSICWRQEYQNSGKPWRRTTTWPSGGPEATAWSSHAPLLKVKCSRAAGTSRESTTRAVKPRTFRPEKRREGGVNAQDGGRHQERPGIRLGDGSGFQTTRRDIDGRGCDF